MTPTSIPHVLLLVSSPLVADPVDVDRALEQLGDALHKISAPGRFIARVAEPDAVSGLLVRQDRPRFQVLHYYGHGYKPEDAEEGKLIFEDSSGGLRPLDDMQLTATLNPTNHSEPEFQVAVLTACHSQSVAEAMFTLGIQHVVAVEADESVLQVAATSFFRRFYQTLLSGGAVQAAFDAGRNAVLMDETLNRIGAQAAMVEAGKFVLLPKGGDHNQTLRGSDSGGESVHVEPLPALTRPPFNQRPTHFVGRDSDLREVLQRLQIHGSVLIQGVSGVGKTELAKECGRWLVARGRVSAEYVAFVPLVNLHTAPEARAAIATNLGLQAELMADDADLAQALPGGALLLLDEAENIIRGGGLAFRRLLECLAQAPARPTLIVTSQADVGSAHLPRYGLRRLTPTAALHLFATVANMSSAQWQALDKDDLLDVLRYLDRLPRAVELVARVWRHRRSPDLKPLLAELQEKRDQIMHDPYYPDEVKSVTVGIQLAYDRLLKQNEAAAGLYPYLALFPGGLPQEGIEFVFGPESGELVPAIEDESLLERPLSDLLYLPTPFRFFAERHLPAGLQAAQAEYGPSALSYYYAYEDEPHVGRVHVFDTLLAQAGEAMGAVIDRYTLELPSMEAWLDWALSGEPCEQGRARAPRLAAQLKNLYTVSGLLRLQRERYEAALACARRCQDQDGQANVHKALGDLALREDDLAGARQHYQAALDIYPAIGARLGQANVHKALGDLALRE
ncbi:MAG: CHAT domain-containing protein, partial [Halieaceae bacterium]|nr:CHAT domain-containing protein [Halieaceae bacterium]